jgi:predicted aconitase
MLSFKLVYKKPLVVVVVGAKAMLRVFTAIPIIQHLASGESRRKLNAAVASTGKVVGGAL